MRRPHRLLGLLEQCTLQFAQRGRIELRQGRLLLQAGQCLLGSLLGVALGVTVALNVDIIVPAIERVLGVQFLSKEIYLISEIPSELRWPDVASIGGLAVLLAFLSTLYPSWAAARINPAQALRYE